ncbi:MAG TPA: biotin--[acetyl-CoA-carboxylase] ligase [Thermoanaerobacterales bacterium]|uniref:biotin--[acetyl-CoA-carboxylase] ligase n=1 Tax=Tepidanaerobacter sp. GT38 TaxID=2722793 RepID=UPI0018437B70|nr:biotin--[acetyl-CoA-carboxylase] ligase [Tepidanaerobacter sp. GT38]MCG1011867.1 biotin--[acetyl-CoA-carboxylase] ligase [Tepidanaerobacter sp. GT38]HHY42709.1 biotin--[acetyl-CoA-carboxylase] ligase [Thermoanaerobacterales bacterium]
MSKDMYLASERAEANQLLMLLLENKGKYISGEKISQNFGITRSAIWKQVNCLRNMGYKIISSPRLGYCLEESPDLLLPEEIWAQSSLKIIGSKIYYCQVTKSTNDDAKKIAQEGAQSGTLVIAEKQQGGRGRMGRSWDSPAGGLWLSIVLRPELSPVDAPKLTIMSAVAVAEAIVQATGICAKIKWPNDILIDGKKVCGILTEMSAEMDAVNYVVIGIGINVNNDDFPDELKDKSTSLRQIKGEQISRIKVLTALLENLEQYYIEAENEGFEKIFEKWRALCVNLGRKVKIIGKIDGFEGTAIDIDASGALLVKTLDGQIKKVVSGDVSLR